MNRFKTIVEIESQKEYYQKLHQIIEKEYETIEEMLDFCEWKLYKDSEEIKEPVVEWSEEEEYVQGKLWIKADQ